MRGSNGAMITEPVPLIVRTSCDQQLRRHDKLEPSAHAFDAFYTRGRPTYAMARRNVRVAAESNGRVFAIMYDISGQPRETLVDAVKRDWVRTVDTLHLTDSPQYLHHNCPAISSASFSRESGALPSALLLAVIQTRRLALKAAAAIRARMRRLSGSSSTSLSNGS